MNFNLPTYLRTLILSDPVSFAPYHSILSHTKHLILTNDFFDILLSIVGFVLILSLTIHIFNVPGSLYSKWVVGYFFGFVMLYCAYCIQMSMDVRFKLENVSSLKNYKDTNNRSRFGSSKMVVSALVDAFKSSRDTKDQSKLKAGNVNELKPKNIENKSKPVNSKLKNKKGKFKNRFRANLNKSNHLGLKDIKKDSENILNEVNLHKKIKKNNLKSKTAKSHKNYFKSNLLNIKNKEKASRLVSKNKNEDVSREESKIMNESDESGRKKEHKVDPNKDIENQKNQNNTSITKNRDNRADPKITKGEKPSSNNNEKAENLDEEYSDDTNLELSLTKKKDEEIQAKKEKYIERIHSIIVYKQETDKKYTDFISTLTILRDEILIYYDKFDSIFQDFIIMSKKIKNELVAIDIHIDLYVYEENVIRSEIDKRFSILDNNKILDHSTDEKKNDKNETENMKEDNSMKKIKNDENDNSKDGKKESKGNREENKEKGVDNEGSNDENSKENGKYESEKSRDEKKESKGNRDENNGKSRDNEGINAENSKENGKYESENSKDTKKESKSYNYGNNEKSVDNEGTNDENTEENVNDETNKQLNPPQNEEKDSTSEPTSNSDFENTKPKIDENNVIKNVNLEKNEKKINSNKFMNPDIENEEICLMIKNKSNLAESTIQEPKNENQNNNSAENTHAEPDQEISHISSNLTYTEYLMIFQGLVALIGLIFLLLDFISLVNFAKLLIILSLIISFYFSFVSMINTHVLDKKCKIKNVVPCMNKEIVVANDILYELHFDVNDNVYNIDDKKLDIDTKDQNEDNLGNDKEDTKNNENYKEKNITNKTDSKKEKTKNENENFNVPNNTISQIKDKMSKISSSYKSQSSKLSKYISILSNNKIPEKSQVFHYILKKLQFIQKDFDEIMMHKVSEKEYFNIISSLELILEKIKNKAEKVDIEYVVDLIQRSTKLATMFDMEKDNVENELMAFVDTDENELRSEKRRMCEKAVKNVCSATSLMDYLYFFMFTGGVFLVIFSIF